MENTDSPIPQHPAEQPDFQPLLLTNSLMAQMLASARFGVAASGILLAVAAGDALVSLAGVVEWMNGMKGGFYLLQGDTLYFLGYYFAEFAAIYLLGRAVWEGLEAWRLLRHSDTDDNALLDGTDRQTKMFRWLVYWGVWYGVSWLINTAYTYWYAQ